jgi:hypothetical protein
MATLIWRRGLRGPSPAVLPDDFLDEYCRSHKLTTHKLKPGEETMNLAELCALYPAPPRIDDDGQAATNHTVLT